LDTLVDFGWWGSKDKREGTSEGMKHAQQERRKDDVCWMRVVEVEVAITPYSGFRLCVKGRFQIFNKIRLSV
jgi:hypothetical protein